MKAYFIKLIVTLFQRISKAERIRSIDSFIQNETLTIGSKTYGYNNLKIHEYRGSVSKIKIGNYTSIAPEVTIITGGIHPIKTVSQFPLRVTYDLKGAYEDGNPYTKGDIIIGSDVWIGTGVTILSGVTIGDGAIIYNNSLINRNIPPYAIVGGIPGKIISKRFSDKEIEILLQIQWWNWPEDQIIKFIPELTSEDINKFIAKAKMFQFYK